MYAHTHTDKLTNVYTHVQTERLTHTHIDTLLTLVRFIVAQEGPKECGSADTFQTPYRQIELHYMSILDFVQTDK